MTAPTLVAPHRPFCVGADGLRLRSDLLEDARGVRAALAGHDAVCNLATRRYDFAATLLAAMAEGIATVLPPSRAEQAVAASLAGYAKPLVLEGIDRRAVSVGAEIAALSGEVHVFTSGSTGAPVRHVKGWTALAGGARVTSFLLEQAGLMPGRALIIGTTPHQHMYGLEASIFAGLANGHCVSNEIAFYPADLDAIVGRAAEAGFDEIALITTPPHLRFLEERVRALPRIRCVISATAPLHRGVALRLEEAGCPLFEIYGCTEAGSLAWRRSARDELWTPFAGFRLRAVEDGWLATAPHLGSVVALPDDIDIMSDGRFRLVGRRGDMVRVAGKRQSLGALNAALAMLSTVGDAVMACEDEDGEDRLHVYVVPAPGGETDPDVLSRLVREHMRRHVDSVFIPRSVTIVSELPRSATGKLTAGNLAAHPRAGDVWRSGTV